MLTVFRKKKLKSGLYTRVNIYLKQELKLVERWDNYTYKFSVKEDYIEK